MKQSKDLFESFNDLIIESMRAGVYGKIDEFDLTFLQRSILILLERNSQISMVTLGNLMGAQKPAITRLIDVLELKGYVARTKLPEIDRRAYYIVLTPKGKSIIHKLNAEPKKILHKTLSTLPEKDRTQISDAFNKFLTALKAIQ